ncbi:fructose-specific PTS system IIA component [Ligilactobacillus salitolerans]|uniref:Fructose-specific PTS system IIA component n=1 Tax=Ligilactobacillus salitolerans TaxID=1808352 RepID=A0A401ISQ9_9LACO|nr:PTS fructose transporter subunit IIA [Ligilactobacillus salitolerans]GBG94554.1 fructose-specific PTS system IIA component [Ligilactobacillus salitolerans]
MFAEENIFFDVDGQSEEEILKTLAEKASDLGATKKPKKVYKDYLRREKESTTGFGNGIAIPHAKSKSVLRPTILFARSENQVEWNALDGKPVNNWISILVPEEDSQVHLNLLAKLSRNLVHEEFVAGLKQGSQSEVYQLIEKVIGEA